MKLEKVREEVYYFSQKASEANQKLSIAGIALVWLFKVSTNGGIQLSLLLFLALTFFIVSLAIEIIHYSFLAPIWSSHYKSHFNRLKSQGLEINVIEQESVEQPNKGNSLGWLLFYGKLFFTVIGYIGFFIHVIKYIEVA